MIVINWNKGSAKLHNKINHIKNIIQNHSPHVLAIHELNHQLEDDTADIKVEGYNWEMDKLLHKNGRSRTGFLIREDIRYIRRDDLTTDKEAHLWITITLQGGKKINLQSLYRHHIPGTLSPSSQRERLRAVTTQWKVAMSEGTTHSFSDTNLNSNSFNKQPDTMTTHDRKQIHLTKILKAEIFNNGAAYINTEDTRYNPVTKKTDKIDHCITTNPELIANHTILKTGDSDHFIGKFTIKTKNNPSQPKFIIKRDYDLIDWDQMKESLLINPNLRKCTELNDPSIICKTIQDTVNLLLDQQAPKRKVQITKKIPIFISQDTKNTLNERDVALQTAKEDDTPENWRQYRSLKNSCHKKLSTDKKNYVKKKLDINNNEHDKWETAKDILGWKTKVNPTVINDRGETVTSPIKIANALNHSLISKVVKITRDIPKTQVDPILNYSKLMTDKNCQLTIHPIGIIELRKLVTKMKASRSAGVDGLSTKLIKKLFKQLEYPILQMINSSISTSTYPETLKTAKVLPLYKVATPPKPQSEPTSYRGININNSLGKILDKVILTQTLTYLVNNELIHENHHGSIKGRSTTTAIATLVDTWSNLVENDNELATMAMDQSAAYDLINHQILLKKMETLGIQPSGIELFRSYLSNRQQVVYLDGATSDPLHIGNRSVIQGSVLSCALYLIYILDLPLLFHDTNHSILQADNCPRPSLQTYVDDIMCTILKKKDQNLQTTIEEAINKIEIYMNSNLLALNRDKTQLMIINKDPPLKSKVCIPAHPQPITPKETLTFLGVTLSETLDWKKFLVDGNMNLYSQLKKRISALKKLRASTNFAFARNLANALFIGKFNYAAEIWGGAPKYIIKRFQSLQLEAARITIGPKSFMWNRSSLLKEMVWMNIEQLLAFTANKLTYKILHLGQPALLAARMRNTRIPVMNNTRLTGVNKLGARPRVVGRTKLTKNQYRAKSYEFYAQIPEAIQNLASFTHFSKWMTKFYKFSAKTPFDKLPTFVDLPTDLATTQVDPVLVLQPVLVRQPIRPPTNGGQLTDMIQENNAVQLTPQSVEEQSIVNQLSGIEAAASSSNEESSNVEEQRRESIEEEENQGRLRNDDEDEEYFSAENDEDDTEDDQTLTTAHTSTHCLPRTVNQTTHSPSSQSTVHYCTVPN